MRIRDRIKQLRRVPARELLGLVAGAWLAGFLLPSCIGGSTVGPIAGGSVAGLLPLPRPRAAAQPGTGQRLLSPPRTRRGEWSAKTPDIGNGADDIDEFCLFPMNTHVDQVDAGSGAYNRLAQDIRFGDRDEYSGGGTERVGPTRPASGWRPIVHVPASYSRPVRVLLACLSAS
jgi:hypothetical protein